jgi:HTH-type transcriptional regulator / antitoxin HigA
MDSLSYKVIKSPKQYKEYCDILETLVTSTKKNQAHQDTIDLLTLLIEKWDEQHNTFSDANPVELLSYLMKENKLKATELANQLGVGKSLISDILHYRRGLSRDIIRKLASRFKVTQELFNRPYKLATSTKTHIAATKKKLTKAI